MLQLGATRWRLFLSAHHIVIDGAGGALFVQRIDEVYTRLCAGLRVGESWFGTLQEVVDSETAYRQGSPRFDKDRAFWTEHMSNAPESVRLAGGPKPRTLASQLRAVSRLSENQFHDVRHLATRLGASVPAVLAAATSILLHQAGRSDDVVLGLPVTGRSSVSRRTPAALANLLPMRLRVFGSMTASELIAQAADEILAVLRRQHYRGVDIARDLGIRGGLHALVSMQLNFMAFDYDLDFAGCAAEHQVVSIGNILDTAITAITDHATDGLEVTLYGNTDLFDQDTIAGWMGMWR